MHIHRTYQATIQNPTQVRATLDRHAWSASKLWNVGRYYIQQEWDDTGEIPEESELLYVLKDHDRYKDLHSQSSQRVLKELARSFSAWYATNDDRANPPGYRKERYYDDDGNLVHTEHPRSTVTWKPDAIYHDRVHERLRLSKGRNHKSSRSDFILIDYATATDVTLEDIKEVRAVYQSDADRWELHVVCRHEVPTPDPPGSKTAGVDLGIGNLAAVAYSDGHADLYPGSTLRTDAYYFRKEIAECADATTARAKRLHRTFSERQRHVLHALARHIVDRCVDRGVGTLIIGDLSGVRETTTGKSKDWGSAGNLRLHNWPFDRLIEFLTYKGRREGITVTTVSEYLTSQRCCCFGRTETTRRPDRGLVVCEACDLAMNADVNGAENIRSKGISESSGRSQGSVDRSIGWVAQPAVFLYDRSRGFQPRATVEGSES